MISMHSQSKDSNKVQYYYILYGLGKLDVDDMCCVERSYRSLCSLCLTLVRKDWDLLPV